MSNDDMRIIGKAVKDMYGTPVGKVVGAMTDIDGTVLSAGVDCGSRGLVQVPFEQLVIQGDVVIFIPKWRLDSQRLLREKGLTLRRLRALMEIVSENDEMKDDASMVNEKYRSQLATFDEPEKEINSRLQERLSELDEQMKSVKMLVFDARIQFKSGEIPESVFESVRAQTAGMIERITHENAEISNVQRRIADLGIDVREALDASPAHLQDSALSYLGDQPEAESKLPEAPQAEPQPAISAEAFPEPPQSGTAEVEHAAQPERADWLTRMETQ
ncbi:conserved hypothetical protein [Cenarchaeum symbiosum A]|uniref:CdvA-like coiled-coil domain-containing protein n=1 Tax=Cenarchaeum symbiosum (strain A) TaxID=414004 RepID=A0RU93_CENSY|nr:conserved hypothetical protein [Cenarchaeum symbiosum A]